ncbi:protein TMED8 [Bombina bombina]|uniref:protein TMED8 n=1 Tax=Bombina bombina TaxID=8345 RepID=UPI00235A8129|nr:protein TMED8 [Bombina bombina]
MSLAPDAASPSGTPSGTGDPDSSEACKKEVSELEGCQNQSCPDTAEDEDAGEEAYVQDVEALSVQETKSTEHADSDEIKSLRPEESATVLSQAPGVGQNEEPKKEPQKAAVPSSLDKELDALLSLCTEESESLDTLMIQSEHSGRVDIVKLESSTPDSEVGKGKAPPPPLAPPSTWTSVNLREFKTRMASEKHGLLTIRRGEVMTVRVPTHPEGKRLCWEFATDDYDIGFGIYFDWTPVTSTAVTLHVSESSDEEEEEEIESPWHSREGDVERGSVYRLRSRYGEIMQVFRRDSHREVQAGSHEYPGEGVYLLKLDNSYSLLRNKTLYFHVYYSS